MIKAILIDLDGTLVDSTPALYEAYLKFLQHFGKKGSQQEFKKLIGPSINEIVAILKKKHELKESESDLSTIYVGMIVMQGFAGTALFPGVKEFLKFAQKANLKLGIVTSGTQVLVQNCLEPHKIYENFDAIITSEDVKKAKPDPEIYVKALKALKVKPEEAIAIEDSEKGAVAAQKASIPTYWITHGKETPKTKAKFNFVKDWKEVLKLLKAELDG